MVAYTYPLFRNSFAWLVIALGSLLAFAQSTSIHFWFLTIFITSSALILCPVIVCCSKSSVDDFIQDQTPQTEQNPLNQPTGVIGTKIDEDMLDLRKAPKICGKNEDMLSSSDALSDTESIDHTSSSDEYSENDWVFRDNPGGRDTQSSSDGSFSDEEESLIEIKLPTGRHYVESRKEQEEEEWLSFSRYELQQQKWSDCSFESLFRQIASMDMLNEMNEENMIEIDLCMGSIKSSRFENEA